MFIYLKNPVVYIDILYYIIVARKWKLPAAAVVTESYVIILSTESVLYRSTYLYSIHLYMQINTDTLYVCICAHHIIAVGTREVKETTCKHRKRRPI